MIQIVSYDVWRTLIKANPTYVELRGKLIASALGWVGDSAMLTRAIDAASRELDHQADATGGVQYGFIDRVAYAARLVGLEPLDGSQLNELQSRVNEAHLANLPGLIDVDLPSVFHRHRLDGRKVAVISNTGMTGGETLCQILDKLRLLEHVEYELYSDILNLAKPDPRIFERLAHMSGVQACDILHVGDNRVADYDGARNAGLRSLLFAPRTTVNVPYINRHSEIFGHLLATAG